MKLVPNLNLNGHQFFLHTLHKACKNKLNHLIRITKKTIMTLNLKMQNLIFKIQESCLPRFFQDGK